MERGAGRGAGAAGPQVACTGRPRDLCFGNVFMWCQGREQIGCCCCDPAQGSWWLAEDSGRNEGWPTDVESTGFGEGRGVREGSFLFWAARWMMGPPSREAEKFSCGGRAERWCLNLGACGSGWPWPAHSQPCRAGAQVGKWHCT